MKTKETKFSWLTILLVAFMSVGFAACGGDDDDDTGGGGLGSGLTGWYVQKSSVAKQSDFNEINEAIRDNELLSSYRYGGETYNHYATYDEFILSNGLYDDTDASYGRLRFQVPSVINAVQIEDSNTILYYNGLLYIEGYGDGDVIYRLYAGSIFGNMAYYGSASYYTYYQLDNKLYVTNGDIFTVTSSGLRRDGDSEIWTKYNPNERY